MIQLLMHITVPKLPGAFDNVWETNNARAGRVLRNFYLFHMLFWIWV